MKNVKNVSLEEFYRDISQSMGMEIDAILPPDINKQIGHFNVFETAETYREAQRKKTMPYNRRAYYKISLIQGRNRAEYADKVIPIEKYGLLFATPKVPYHYVALDPNPSGYFCVFTETFLHKNKSGVILDELPIFRSGGYPLFEISETDAKEIESVFLKMQKEIASDYQFKYDLLRNFVLELIHYGQKLQPTGKEHTTQNAASRIISLFIELLERQFPIESPGQKLELRTAKDFAQRLAVHVNHLNKVLKENTGKTTTEIIKSRVVQEAKILLRQTDWNVSEIAYSLGFEELAHFSNFFKKQTELAPLSFRS